MGDNGVNIADYPSFHEFLKSYLIVELKSLIPTDVVLNEQSKYLRQVYFKNGKGKGT